MICELKLACYQLRRTYYSSPFPLDFSARDTVSQVLTGIMHKKDRQ